MNRRVACAAVLLLALACCTSASDGDGSPVFFRCVRACVGGVCNGTAALERFRDQQGFFDRATAWDCDDECRYACMWTTVAAFRDGGYGVPQFYGKWPFTKWLGMQEPASAIFSALNLLTHLGMYVEFRRRVRAAAPMFSVWSGYAAFAVNAWAWSTVFHTRDYRLTEMLDYFCAVLGVLYSFFGLCVRVLGTDRWWKPAVPGVAILLFFVYHVHYLAFIKFDYGYNMRANIAVGMVNSVGWLVWFLFKRKTLPHAYKVALTVVLVNLLLILELGDFPPLLWTFDAHSLWHLGTAPLPFLLYSFFIDDCNFLLDAKEKLKFP
ncbi:PREDICTED: post-GPI attachment to proteins factor 3-like [Priapulus caudatus]|uniref:Post-GPI attachment to proteins factor 3 n=1 Tax=Priapulus caudatus TaxID=37621 RepID=A0ABM1DTA3_PRICU|nr:PREDICTED: post-GPI attachment to proteins factor 3-like [Priapulus caudatus]